MIAWLFQAQLRQCSSRWHRSNGQDRFSDVTIGPLLIELVVRNKVIAGGEKMPTLQERITAIDGQFKNLAERLNRMEGLCEKISHGSVSDPISTLAPEPFEIIKEFKVVVQPEEDSFNATLFDANISSSGDTQAEEVANLKDLILMVFQQFEREDDGDLGPSMIRQKHALQSLIRRR
ncbi:MAG: hypothetical protein ACHRXM_19240 [Isosphaerales bacterium]